MTESLEENEEKGGMGAGLRATNISCSEGGETRLLGSGTPGAKL